MAVTFRNSLAENFLAVHFNGEPYTDENFNKYYAKYREEKTRMNPNAFHSLNIVFSEYLEKQYKAVSEASFIDFKTRFSYFRTDKGDTAILTTQPKTGTWTFSRGKDVGPIGTMREKDGLQCIYSGDTLKAKYVGKILTYHEYNADTIFAGIPNEIICQLPREFLGPKNDKEYYYTWDNNRDDGQTSGFRFECHFVALHLYEVVN
jgi:hypothetical protein